MISVIIPTHNRVDLLARSIRSVLNQTYPDLECIVVDDASTDDSEIVIAQFDDDRLVYLQHENSRGASAARNTGIAHAQGELIAFLDDDDEWLPDKLEKQVRLLANATSRVGMVYCWLDYYEGDQIVEQYHPEYRGYIFPDVLDRQRIGNSSTLLVRSSVLDEIGGFDDELPRGNDGDFIRRVAREYWVDYVPEVLVRVYVGHGLKRITQNDKKSIWAAIKGESAKLVKFKDEIPKYPRQTAMIYAKIAHHYSQLGDWRNCLSVYRKAFAVSPLHKEFYPLILASLKKYFLHNTENA